MLDLKTLTSAVMEIAEERGILKEKVIEVIEGAIAAAYKKEYGQKKQKFIAALDSKTGEIKFWQLKLVVDEDMIFSEQELEEMKSSGKETIEKEESASAKATADKEKIRFNPERHILLKEAKKIDSKIKIGEELKIKVAAKEDFGRISAQTAKQVILQRIKEAERQEILKEYHEKEEEIVSGIVQRVEPRVVFFDVGRISAILPKPEQIPGEFYKPGQRMKLYIVKVEDTPRGPVLFVSRSYAKIVSKLFELEVPEISSGQVEIKSIAREPGSRSKIAVTALEEGIDPIGSMVGQKGTRIWAVVNELGGEKIDVIEWAEKPEKYIANALSPAKILEVKTLSKNKAEVMVPNDQLSLAIGKDGQNVRLAAKLTGWKIDIVTMDGTKKKTFEEKGGERETKKEIKKQETEK